MIDSTCNPYLALASILWSGLNGIEKKSTLRPSMKRGDRAAPPLPSSLGESIERLRKDQLLMDLLGDELFLAYTALKKAEIEYWEKVDNLEKYSLQKDAFSLESCSLCLPSKEIVFWHGWLVLAVLLPQL